MPSRVSSLSINRRRPVSVASAAGSDTTYHSFHDIEMYKPPAALPAPAGSQAPPRDEDEFKFKPILRHDSGYESIRPRSRSAASRPAPPRRDSSMSTGPAQPRIRARPSVRRSVKSTSSPRIGAQTLHAAPPPPPPPPANTYFCFPPLEPLASGLGEEEDEDARAAEPAYPPPPQTTHYWLSDHTRRLEYAAIDAASRGVKGWFLKHVVPDCFVPKASRRVGFDDDTGSVRRYRLELECEEAEEKAGGGAKKLGWLFGR
ncbi:hypothetical protein GGS23DRAFT_601271 [Durotheca rogersii]|uniref:uncharacterized protein n=1 Tax=Durotheca rogersii TaxID=419775 RepID=UPI0022211E75|nr:uncharacterized protein GGS23DRAFT_601271 [Durotheca rogersii]KAI5856163.1 hypothetical protein GGS23DRAFT_601271 [Durotheca rogersii]